MKAARLAGGRRVKHRGKRIKKNHTIDNNYKQYTESVNNFNSRLEKLKDNNYLKFRDYSTQLIKSVSDQLKRADFRDRNEFRKFKESKLKYIFSSIFYPKDNVKILVKSDNYDYIHNTYYDSGITVLNNMIVELQNSLDNETYIVKDPAKEYNVESFLNSCNILGINKSVVEKKMLFSDIKSIYDKEISKVKDSVDKQLEINEAYLNIRNQYDNYLNSFNELDTTVLDTEN